MQHEQQRSTLRGDFMDSYSSQDGIPPAWLLRQPYQMEPKCSRGYDIGLQPSSKPCQVGADYLHISKTAGQACDVYVDVFLRASPSFEKGPNGTFIVDLPDMEVNVSTSCSPSPKALTGVTVFRPQLDFLVTLPELQRLVFDPRLGGSTVCSQASLPNHIMVLELPSEHSLNVKMNTDAPRGRLTIEDIEIKGNRRTVVGDAILHYEAVADGRLSFKKEGNYNQVHVDLDFEFKCWLEGSACCAETHDLRRNSPRRFEVDTVLGHSGLYPQADSSIGQGIQNDNNNNAGRQSTLVRSTALNGKLPHSKSDSRKSHESRGHSTGARSKDSVAASSTVAVEEEPRCEEFRHRGRSYSMLSTKALSQLFDTDEQLAQIERNVAHMAIALQGKVGVDDMLRMKGDLSQLEAKAKRLEAKGIDDVYTGELNSGRQLAKDTKKDMLRRLEKLFTMVDGVFANIKAIQN